MVVLDKRPMPVSIDGKIFIEDVTALPKLGAGHDGYVFKYKNRALKILKYDIARRKDQDLMTFAKAKQFRDCLKPKRITNPNGILFDEDGIFCGYSMKFLDDITKKSGNQSKQPSEFTTSDLLTAIDELESDTFELSRNKILMQDINRGSYIFTSDFMNICDMDKFIVSLKNKGIRENNAHTLNFIFAKFMFYELQKKGIQSKEQLKVLNAWVKKCSNSPYFLDEMRRELESIPDATISHYLDEKQKIINL